MLTVKDLQEFITYRPGFPVLSVYLSVDPSLGSADVYKLRLRQLIKEFDENAADDVEVIERYIEHEYDWSGRSLVFFSCAKNHFFRSYSLSLPVRDRARRLNRPYVKPLVDLIDNYGNYGVALVDKQGIRMFHFHLGELWEQQGTMGEAIRQTKLGGGSQATGRRSGIAGRTRYSDEATDRNFKQSAHFAARFFKEHQIRRVLVGGTESNIARFIDLLPRTWQSLVMGSFPMEMIAGHAQVLDKAVEVVQAAKQAKESRLVQAIVTAAAKGREGVIRLDDTLGAAHAGNVQTLVVSEGYRAPGFRCVGCEHISTQEFVVCPFCGDRVEKIPDAVELTIQKVLTEGGEVEVIRDNPDLERAGRIGALLRY